MSEFKREPRYLVMKFKDIDAYLSPGETETLLALSKKIHCGRHNDGKVPFCSAVVEQDWPEFEPTWAAIEARMAGKPSPLATLQSLARQLGEALEFISGNHHWDRGPHNVSTAITALAAFDKAKKEGLL
jgi:hypothetical protein